MKRNKPMLVFPEGSGHALIDVHIRARSGCEKVDLIADPLHFVPDEIQRIAGTIEGFLNLWIRAENREAESSRQGAEDVGLHDRISPVVNPDSSGGSLQRVLISLVKESGVTLAELAYASGDPSLLPARGTDWLITKLNDSLNDSVETEQSGHCFGGQN